MFLFPASPATSATGNPASPSAGSTSAPSPGAPPAGNDAAANPFGSLGLSGPNPFGSLAGLSGLSGMTAFGAPGGGANNLQEMQRNMMREIGSNPESVRQILDNPMVQQLMQNPDVSFFDTHNKHTKLTPTQTQSRESTHTQIF